MIYDLIAIFIIIIAISYTLDTIRNTVKENNTILKEIQNEMLKIKR